jgi:hypothetical protein
MHRSIRTGRRQRGALWMVLAGLVVAAVMVAAWISSGRIGYLLSGAGFLLLVPSYWTRAPASAAGAAAPARWVTVSAFAGGVLVLVGLIVTFLA